MNPQLKTRSDYHDLKPSESNELKYHHWFKPVAFVVLGFMLGLMFNKKEVAPQTESFAMSEQPSKASLHTEESKPATIASATPHAIVIPKNTTKNQAVAGKGSASTSKA